MDWEALLLDLLGQRRKEAPEPARAENEVVPFPGDEGRPTQVPAGGGTGLNPARGAPELMDALRQAQQEEISNNPMDPVAAMGDLRFGRDVAVRDMQALEAARAARFGPAPPPVDPEQAALLDQARAQASPPGILPEPPPILPQVPPMGLQPEMLAAIPGPAGQPAQAPLPTQPGGGPQATAPATPSNIDLPAIFAEVMQNLRSQGPMLQAGPRTPAAPNTRGPPRPGIAARAGAAAPAPSPFPFSPAPSAPNNQPRPGIAARAAAAAPEAFPFPVFAPPRTPINMPANPNPSPATNPAAQATAARAPQHFQFPYQVGSGEAQPQIQAAPRGPAPTQLGAEFASTNPGLQSSADVLNLAEAQRIREVGGPTNVPFAQELPGLPSNELPGPPSTPTAPAPRSAQKPGVIPAEVPGSSIQKPKPNAGMGTEAPPGLKESLLAEALRLSQKRRNPQSAGAM